jgi:hypothetical protein
METSDGARDHVFLRGLSRAADARESAAPSVPPPPAPGPLPASFTLGESHYRRSEESWDEVGAPGAAVTIAIEPRRVLSITAMVEPSSRLFVPPGTENALDNEPAAINGDGVQLYLACGVVGGAWLLVPQAGGDTVWISSLTGWGGGLEPAARWRPTAAGYRLDVRVALPRECSTLALDLLINETAPGRARRRGQLVLSGAQGEFVYLRGDRHDPNRLLRFMISDV